MKSGDSKSSKVIIFDWDDTLCPSFFVDQWKVDCFKDLPLHDLSVYAPSVVLAQGLHRECYVNQQNDKAGAKNKHVKSLVEISHFRVVSLLCQFQNLLKEIGKCAEKCLEAASHHGEVIIITNSDDGWVHFSAERFVPNLLPVLSKYRIVSARTRYEHFYPGQPLCWKAAAFAHEVNETFTALEVKTQSRSRTETHDSDNTLNSSSESLVSTDDSSNGSQSSIEGDTSSGACFNRKNGKTMINSSPRREVISFGDSMEERTAVKIVSGQLSAVPKSVMFITTPTPLQLIGQLTMLTAHMKFVCENSSSLDLEISSDQAQKCADTYMEQNKSLGGQTGLLQIVSLE